MSNLLETFAGPSAVLAGIFSILSFLALFIFFAGVSVFGPINDALSVIQFLLLIPVFVVFHMIVRPQSGGIAVLITVTAVATLLAMAVMQSLLVLGRVGFQQTLRPILLLGFVLGAWWILTGLWSRDVAGVPEGHAWAGIITGVSFIVIAFGFLVFGQSHPITAIGFLVGAVALPVWALWLGRLIQSHQILLPAW